MPPIWKYMKGTSSYNNTKGPLEQRGSCHLFMREDILLSEHDDWLLNGPSERPLPLQLQVKTHPVSDNRIKPV